jgi:multidrug resistance protein, MATE family
MPRNAVAVRMRTRELGAGAVMTCYSLAAMIARAPISRLPRPTRADLRALSTLALPVMALEMGMMLMGVVDILFIGHVSATALAAVALAHIYYYSAVMLGLGTLMGFDSLTSQAVGAGDEDGLRRSLQRGLVLALLLCIPLGLALWPTTAVLKALHQSPEIIPMATRYVHLSILGLPGIAFVVLRQTLQSLGRVRPLLVAMLIANVVNAALNWVFVFGNLGAPTLGITGSAVATVVSRYVLVAATLWLARDVFAPRLRSRDPLLFEWRPLARMLVLGLPVGVQYLLEGGVFNAVALLLGAQAASVLAAHQVAINLASFTFMMPLGIGAATSVLVGQAIGRGDTNGARRAALAGLVAGMAVMTVSAVIFLTMPRLLASAYVREAPIIALAATLIPLAGVFQLFDGLQAVAGGALRGAADTRAAMVANVLGFWAVGLPLGLWLTYRRGYGPAGLWWGLVVGLAAVSLVLLVRVRWRFRGDLVRVRVDDLPLPVAS